MISAEQEPGLNAEVLQPTQALLHDLNVFACKWGGSNYRGHLTDGVEFGLGSRERGEMSETKIGFRADRYREKAWHEPEFTMYCLVVEVTREVPELPPHVLRQVLEEYEMESIGDAILIEERQNFTYSIRDKNPELEIEAEIKYVIDSEEVYSFSSEDDSYDEDDDEDDGTRFDAESLDGEPAELKLHPELKLLNDAWEVIEAAGGNLVEVDSQIGPETLRLMASIHRRLEKHTEKQEIKAWRFFTHVDQEISDLLVENCRRIVKKNLKPNANL